MPGSRGDRSVRGIANGNERNEFKQDFDRIGLDLKVCGTIQFFGPAPKRNGESNYFFLDQPRGFFQHDDGNDNGMFPLLDLLKNSAPAFTQSLLTVGSPGKSTGERRQRKSLEP